MKKLYSVAGLLILAFSLLFSTTSNAQCPTCVPDESCISVDGLPTICPLVPPDATAGVYYEEQLTFYMPSTIIDPQTNIEATLLEVSIASVSGLPFGLEFTLNDADGVFYPSEGENFGCATICGTPLLPGIYDIVITVNGLVSVFGFEASQTQSFTSVLQVIPGEGSANSFSFDNIAGCGSTDVNFEALLSVPAPSVTTYSWDFGNGETAEGITPSTVSYTTPGAYTAQLTTTVSDFTLQSVTLSAAGGGWNDLEEVLTDPDPYFNLINGENAVVYSSSIQTDVTGFTWDGINIVLTTPPYSIVFYDDDQFNDDNIGTADIAIADGSSMFDVGNGTVGSVNIVLETTTEVIDSTTITVFEVPDATITQNSLELSITASDVATVIWYRNGVAIDGEFGTSYVMDQGGLYSAVVTNSFGCSSSSESVLYCAPVPVAYDAASGEVFVEDIFESYQWYFNGLSLDGANNYYYATTEPGNYMVEVTTDYGCETESAVYVLVSNVEENQESGPTVYPNPADERVFIKNINNTDLKNIAIYDLMGRQVSANVAFSNANVVELKIAHLEPGVYFAVLNGKRIRWVKK